MSALFSKKINTLPRLLGGAIIVIVFLSAVVLYYAASPGTWRSGYAPEQPIPFSHKLHVTELGMDCAACHRVTGESTMTGLPDLQSCMACHKHILPDSAKLIPLHAALNKDSPHYTGRAVVWKKVHDLPDHVFFPHSSHINKGIACSSCHGNVEQMERIAVKESLSMAWCLKCHRNPEPHLRPLEAVTRDSFDWNKFIKEHPSLEKQDHFSLTPEEFRYLLSRNWKINPPADCSSCHH